MNTHHGLSKLLLVAVTISTIAVCQSAFCAEPAKGPYEPDWQSLRNYNAAPEWFRDAKYGIYMHWGVYSVPAFDSEWYPRNMHIKSHRAYKHHVETYGDPAKFGYHDFVPMFKAEHFDPDEWAELFAKSGARYAGLVVEHHDGFSMWDSELTPWNAKDKGAKRDITGELAQAVRKKDMRFVATFHHARNNQHLENHDGVLKWDGHYPRVEGWPTVSEDPELRMLYGNLPRNQFLDLWLGKLEEVIDKYQPDLIWFDSWLDEIPETYHTAFLAHYFNRANEWGKEVVVTCKQRDLPFEVAVEDFEKGRASEITEHPFLTDDTISYGSWCYTENLRIKPLHVVIHTFIDIVSKNGQLLLNISPMADGTIPDEQRNVLLGLGKWLDRNGEAMYDTRPFIVYGEGPTKMKKGGHFVGNVTYGPEDIRFTVKGNDVYAVCLGKVGETVEIHALGKTKMPALDVKEVSMLGHAGDLKWKRKKDALVIEVPEGAADDIASAFKITVSGLATACSGVEPEGSNKVATTLTCKAFSETNWEGEASIAVSGKKSDAVQLTAAPGETRAFRMVGFMQKEGYNKVAVRIGRKKVAEQKVLSPVIKLTHGWRFQKGDDEAYRQSGYDDSRWQQVTLPSAWESHSNYTEDPAFGWYRKTIGIPEAWKRHDLMLPLGTIDDADITYFNGEEIGRSGTFPPEHKTAYQQQRLYRVPSKLIRYGGENVIAIRAYDSQGGGGLNGGVLGPVQLAD